MSSDSRKSIVSQQGYPSLCCEIAMVHRHYKYACPEYGVGYDCSDRFWR
ncbi:hypothetical protein [Haloquadratum walsbyi]|nr:hypothetical protein [Haloquadratum walsbyi]